MYLIKMNIKTELWSAIATLTLYFRFNTIVIIQRINYHFATNAIAGGTSGIQPGWVKMA